MVPSRVSESGDFIAIPAVSEHNVSFQIKVERSMLHRHFGADGTPRGDCACVTPTLEFQFAALGFKKFRAHSNAEVFITEQDLPEVLAQPTKLWAS